MYCDVRSSFESHVYSIKKAQGNIAVAQRAGMQAIRPQLEYLSNLSVWVESGDGDGDGDEDASVVEKGYEIEDNEKNEPSVMDPPFPSL
jgi:hypothetical protein